jgi:hypothetical protein
VWGGGFFTDQSDIVNDFKISTSTVQFPYAENPELKCPKIKKLQKHSGEKCPDAKHPD